MKIVHPVKAGTRVTSGFRSPKRPDHTGTDYAAATGTPIYAAHAGVVELNKNDRAGLNVEVNADGLVTGYSHLSRVTVKAGQRVEAGDKIGEAGATGNATGPHLHFYVVKRGKFINPSTWLRSASKPSSSGGSSSKPSKGRVLALGTWDDPEVGELQRVLNAWFPWKKPLLKVDNDYGTRTQARVKWFQARAGLTVDGRAGDETLGALNIR